MRRRLPFIALPAVLALLTAACGSGALPKLPGQASGAGGKAETASAAMDMSMRVANIRYELADGVKVDKDTGKAYRFGKATEADVKRLAKAFGVAGSIKADEYGWSVGDAAQGKSVDTIQKTLYVGKEGSFSMSLAYPEQAVACSSPGAMPSAPDAIEPAIEPMPAEDFARCDAPTTTTTAPSNPITAADAKKIARDALENAGVDLDGATVDATGDALQQTVFFKPSFDGHTVAGYELAATVDSDRAVTSANGLLHSPESVGSYELASLQRAVERLNESFGNAFAMEDDAAVTSDLDASTTNASPVGGPAIDVPAEDPGTSSSEPTVVTLTKASVGLMLQSDSTNTTWLVPSYLFESADGGQVVAAAADDKYIEKPQTSTTEPAIDPGSGGGSSGSGGATEPARGNCTPIDSATGISGEVCPSATTIKVGQSVTFVINMADDNRQFEEGCADGVSVVYGDNGDGDVSCLACQTTMSDGPGKASRSLSHTYNAAGTFTAEITLKSGLSCGPANPNDSVATVRIPITVV